MTYPPQNPYDPNQQQGGFGQPQQGGYGQSSQPQHFNTDADPYARPDQYGQPGYSNPPMSVAPGSVPPGGPPQQPPAFGTGQAFQPGQPAPAPPAGSSNTPLIVTLAVIVVAVAAGAIGIGIVFSGDDDEGQIATEETSAEESPSEVEETSEEPTEEVTTDEVVESEYRVPEVDECIENVLEGFYVVPCDSDDAYWLVLHIEHDPEDPDPDDPTHAVAATDACADHAWKNYYYTDTALLAGRDWDPDLDSITAIYCVTQVE